MLGRLTPLRDDSAGQEFPNDWKKEMSCLYKIGANCTEWIIVSEDYHLLKNTDLSKYPISSINVHWSTIKDLEIKDISGICKAAKQQGIFNITIPLMDSSSIIALKDRERIIKKYLKVSKEHPEIFFSFETELTASEMLPILNLSPNFYITYDTGNVTSYGYNHREEIETYNSKINNIHLKDRLFGGPSVKPFSGNTDFECIFYTLKKINYTGSYILETFRGPKHKEISTVSNYIKQFRELYEKYF